MRPEDQAFLDIFGVSDLPWVVSGPHLQNGFTYLTLAFPGGRINALVTDVGKLCMGLHRDPNSSFYDVGYHDSERGAELLKEVREKLGLQA